MSDFDDVDASGAGKGAQALTPMSAKDVRLSRRMIIGMLLASAGAGNAAAETSAQVARKPVGKAVTPPDLTLKDVQVRPEIIDQVARLTAETWSFSNPEGDLKSFSLFRARDLVNLNIKLVNLIVTGTGASRSIKRVDPGKPALMIVRFPPQAITESTWLDMSSQVPTPPVINKIETAKTRISGQSRLSFQVPGNFSDMPFTSEAVLAACAAWPLKLDARSLVPPAKFFPQAHEFDRTRQRLSAIAEAQKAKLHEYDPHIEALLTRAARRISDAIASAAAKGKSLSDKAIDNLITYEITATFDPASLSPESKAAKTLVPPKGAFTYLEVQSTQTLFLTLAEYTDTGTIANPALAEAMTTLKPIAADSTDIEIPFRLHMTPAATAGFSHANAPVDHGGGYAELWHTRMGTRVSDWNLGTRAEPLRALWADDFGPGHEDLDTDPDHAWPLTMYDRFNLIRNMTGYQARNANYVALPAMARHLRLTALGASMEARGEWPSQGLSLWHHITSIGRDQYVRVVYEGFLFPFGHRAAFIKVAERKFTQQIGGGRVAGLMMKYFIVVRERVREYPGISQRYEGRDFPFSSVEITTRQTPDLKTPVRIADVPDSYYEGDPGSNAFMGFWPVKAAAPGGNFPFQMIGIDAAGRRTAFEMPLIFVEGERQAGSLGQPDALDLINGMKLEHIIKSYNAIPEASSRSSATVNNALIRFSSPVASGGAPLGDDGEHDYNTARLRFSSWKATAEVAQGDARFYPGLADADIEVPSVKGLIGTEVKPKVVYHKTFLAKGFDPDANPADMVFSFAKQTVGNVTTDRFGGLLTPGLQPDGLSRKLGAVTGAAQIIAKNIQPMQMFPDSAMLLGFVPIGGILNEISLVGAAAGAPKVKTVTSGDEVVTTYELVQPTVGKFEPMFYPQTPENGPQLRVVTTVTVDKQGGAPQSSVDATLRNFRVNLFGFIILNFRSLNMVVKPGTKTDVNPDLEPGTGVMFGGPLEFLNSMRDFIPMSGFSDPPGVDVSPNGLTASYTLSLPDIGVGALTLQNVSLGAGFDLPFTGGGPSARFNFAERHNPFNLTVSMFGGGGFFAIALDTGGVRELEAALEFGAQIQINLGVASGGVYVKAGIYFHWKNDLVAFSGYVEVGGHLSVLGLITVSLVFHLELTYEKTPGHSRLYGTATLTVEIDILFFSCSQDVTVEREFAGSDADPLFIEFCPGNIETNSSATWKDYCRAFA